jgi:hypothetical protein
MVITESTTDSESWCAKAALSFAASDVFARLMRVGGLGLTSEAGDWEWWTFLDVVVIEREYKWWGWEEGMMQVWDQRENAKGGDKDHKALQCGQTQARRAVKASVRVWQRNARAMVSGAAMRNRCC